ncbi:Uncharacterised protein [Paucimonas lemoignei]|jgi:hypothetical protein|nr:Uncharacterised protein [Paucimonas lemoignei]
MARKELNQFEAVSAVVPGEGGYDAAIAVKALGAGGAPVFNRVLAGQKFKTAHDADVAAAGELARLVAIDDEGTLQFEA